MVICDLTIEEIKKVAADYFKVLPNRIRVELKHYSLGDCYRLNSRYIGRDIRINVKGSYPDYSLIDEFSIYLLKGFTQIYSGQPVYFPKVYDLKSERNYTDNTLSYDPFCNSFFRGICFQVRDYSEAPSGADSFDSNFNVLMYKISVIS